MIKTFSLKESGNLKLSNNFIVREFACKDGSDKVVIDVELIAKLQDLRTFFDKPINITSAYRTASYNRKCGGKDNSYHVLGMAADIYSNDINPKAIALWAEFNGLNGIGLYINRSDINFVHIDTRPKDNKYLWINDGGKERKIKSFIKELI